MPVLHGVTCRSPKVGALRARVPRYGGEQVNGCDCLGRCLICGGQTTTGGCPRCDSVMIYVYEAGRPIGSAPRIIRPNALVPRASPGDGEGSR